ncbi:MAG: hypothetical protein OEM97_04435 [Acidimicrobiia bacterium]|nr:hypothetical protein [Acidimicrobiia bacterium]
MTAPPPGTPPPPRGSTTQVVDSYVGSPLYEVIPEHETALVMALLLPVVVWAIRRVWPQCLGAFDRLEPVHRLLAWILVLTTIVHTGLVLGHEPSGFTVLYVGGAVAPLLALRRLLSGKPWKRMTRVVLLGLTLGYMFTSFSEPPDSFGLTAKLAEITGLAIAFRPDAETRWRGLGASFATFMVAFAVALGGWIGAFAAGDGGHHLGASPPPGVLLPPGEDRPPTTAEAAAAAALHRSTVAALARYQDPAVAAAAGYDTTGLTGSGFHAENEALKDDGRVLDPEFPETLVYAVAGSGTPVLLGAQFQTDDVGHVGPAVGGPLTVWHAHDHICVSLPFGLAGFTSPYGMCPLGTFTVPVTNEMLHVWIVPGLEGEKAFGDIDEQWLTAYLAVR